MSINNDPNKLLIKLGYNVNIILPFEKGTELLNCLEYAELKDTSDYENPIITPYKGDIEASIMSDKEYKSMKADALLKKK